MSDQRGSQASGSSRSVRRKSYFFAEPAEDLTVRNENTPSKQKKIHITPPQRKASISTPPFNPTAAQFVPKPVAGSEKNKTAPRNENVNGANSNGLAEPQGTTNKSTAAADPMLSTALVPRSITNTAGAEGNTPRAKAVEKMKDIRMADLFSIVLAHETAKRENDQLKRSLDLVEEAGEQLAQKCADLIMERDHLKELSEGADERYRAYAKREFADAAHLRDLIEDLDQEKSKLIEDNEDLEGEIKKVTNQVLNGCITHQSALGHVENNLREQLTSFWEENTNLKQELSALKESLTLATERPNPAPIDSKEYQDLARNLNEERIRRQNVEHTVNKLTAELNNEKETGLTSEEAGQLRRELGERAWELDELQEDLDKLKETLRTAERVFRKVSEHSTVRAESLGGLSKTLVEEKGKVVLLKDRSNQMADVINTVLQETATSQMGSKQ
ncbi:hypothetical protein P152DRAFT_475375 [Eremomyces bilateralis CBS 781.70]|uniref:Uncharacterized protein n=1 Tax=Eremomyces bilateralis CBS 781.70 TaxID=1392243 RepID=A0A6G1FXM8_9PEZI|nr:uncharacterized protein P152DRAFT_475375 [Eremomyces bilateralis CBS 781.70]KAF1810534.1 hypothetical protein P152DRAFT_475375 [Eremomyces bilateralis CBS 781.70]